MTDQAAPFAPSDDLTPPLPKRGGARPGAGRPRKDGGDASNASTVFVHSRAKREMYRANLAMLEYKTRAGELLEATAVAQTWADQVAIAKGRLLALPARVAPMIVGLGDMREIEKIIRDAVYGALTELSSDDNGA